jgi:transposase
LTIPGVDRRTAEVVLAEIGPDRGRFPSAAHPASGRVCPGNHESAGQHLLGQDRKGSKWLRTALVQAATAAARAKTPTWPPTTSAATAARAPQAIVAVAHAILVLVWHLLTGNQPYSDPGGTTLWSASTARPTPTGSSDS